MQRRSLAALALLAVLVLLAGCSAAGSLDMRPVNATELADGASRSVASLPDDRPESERRPAALVRAAVANGSATATALSPPVTGDLPFAVGGAYYNLTRTVVDRTDASVVSVRVGGNATDGNGTAIAYADLPPADREALAPLVSHLERVGGDEAFGVGAVYTDAELNASVLAPAQQYDAVIVDGQRYALNVDDPRRVTVKIYRYEATLVAPNASAYAAHLRETYAFSLSNLTDAERSVVEAAAEEGGYYADSTDDAAFQSVVERFRRHEAVAADRGSGTWLVRYEGELYLADLYYGAFTDE